MKIVTVIGARPQFIKAAPLAHAIDRSAGVENVLVHTGQHYDANMSDIFFEELGIPKPVYNLGIGGTSHGAMTGRQLEAIETVLINESPDVLLVYGDTNSTLAGALAACKMHIPVAHVEAGLRSFNRAMPEEINRVLTDHASTWLFAPTQEATTHLSREGISDARVHLIGDVMFDAARIFGAKAAATSNILTRLNLTPDTFRLATVHRQENTDHPERLNAIFTALRHAAKDMPLVLPLHPRTQKILEATGDFAGMTEGLTLTKPLGFFDTTCLLKNAILLLSDSGGMQKEGYFHGTPVVILRDETEWVELLAMNFARLVPPTSPEVVISAIDTPAPMGDTTSAPYGDGFAADRIIQVLTK